MAKQKITQAQMNIIIDGLTAYEASWERKSNSKGVDAELKAIYDRKAAEVAATRVKLTQGEIEL